MKRFLLAMILLVGTGATYPPQQQLPAWVSSAPLWQWIDIPNTALSSVAPNPPSIGWPSAKITAWNGAALKRSGSIYLIGAAGGHADYAGNEVNALRLNTATPQWEQLIAPSPTSQIINGPAQFYLDLRPSPTHTYYASQFVDSLNRLVILASPGINYSPGSIPDMPAGWPYEFNYGSTRSFSFDLTTNQWDHPDYFALYPGGGDFTAAMVVKHPVTDDIYMSRTGIAADGGWFKWTRATNTWSGTKAQGNETNYCGAAIDPTRNRMLIVGSYNGLVPPRVRDLSGTLVPVTFTGLGPSALTVTRYPGMVYDEANDAYLVLSFGFEPNEVISIVKVDAGTWEVTKPTLATLPMRQNGVLNAVQYVPELGGIVMALTYEGNVKFMRTSGSGVPPPPQPPGDIVGTLSVSSPVTGNAPFMSGLGFKKGAVVSPVLDIPGQVIVKTRWNDGSVKLAIASGETALTANAAKTVNVRQGTPPTGTALTAANIQQANPQASVVLPAGTVNLSTLLATPVRTWLSGPEMVEAHYQAQADPDLSVWFQVRLYKSGRLWIRAIVENGVLNTTPAVKTYTPTVTIGGGNVYSAALTHYPHTRWMAEGWIGANPQVTAKQVASELIAAKLAPNYWKTPTDAALAGLLQAYVPLQPGSLNPNMGNAGFQPAIGVLPLWDALYVKSGDVRAYRAVLANSSSLNSFAVIRRDPNTKGIPRPSDWPTYGMGAYGLQAGNLFWEMNHAPSEGYLAYLLTGDYWHYETMMFNAAVNYLALSTNFGPRPDGTRGTGVNKLLVAETRGSAWNLRTLVQVAAIAPDGDPVATDYRTLLANNMAFWKTVKDGLGGVGIGYLFEYSPDLYGPGIIAPWQQHFLIQSVGMGSDLEPLPNMAAYNEVRDWLYRASVGITGDASGFCFNNAGLYNLKTSNGGNANPSSWFPTWKAVETATLGTVTCGNTLLGSSGSAPGAAATGYWGNMLPALAYAVDHGAPGAAASWGRLTSATNWSAVELSGFDSLPNWGIVPRGAVVVPPPPPPPVNQRPVFLQLVGNQTLQIPSDGSTTASKVLNAPATDDGLPGPLSYLWVGAGLNFGQPTQPATNVTASAGNYAATVTVTDGALHATQSFTVTVLAANVPPVNERPTVWINNPANNQIITVKTLTVSVEAFDDVGIACLELYINNILVKPCVASNKLSYPLNTNPYKGKSILIKAVARDAEGLMADSTVSATVRK